MEIMEEVRNILDDNGYGQSTAHETSDIDLVFESAQHPDLIDESAAKRAKMAEPGPNDTEVIRKLRQIVKDHQAMKIEGQLVDAFSASAAIQVFDALNQANQKKMASMSIGKMMQVVWRVLERR